eukprot:Gb_32992 [translate_table: standard]
MIVLKVAIISLLDMWSSGETICSLHCHLLVQMQNNKWSQMNAPFLLTMTRYLIFYVFSVIAPPNNLKNMQYYLLRCTASKRILNVEFTDADGFIYPTGSMVVMGHFFQNIAQNDSDMTYKDYHIDRIIFQYSHLIVAVRLSLAPIRGKGKVKKWKLSIEDHEKIIENISARDEPDGFIDDH